MIKYEVWQGGELCETFKTEEDAIKSAKIRKEHGVGSVWINKITIERIGFMGGLGNEICCNN